MPRLIKNIRGRHLVEFDRGNFDDWCIFLKRQGQQRYAPRDTEYFSILQLLGNTHGHEKIYNDFVAFYLLTTKEIVPGILDLISELSNAYRDDAEEIEIWFTVIYAGMIAEENKTLTMLGKRIKRLGMHQTLIEQVDPGIAAGFSIGKKWPPLDALMRTKGF